MTGRAELFRALGALAEPPEPGHTAIAAALDLGVAARPGDYAEVFLFSAYPYASVYLGAEGMLGGEARDRVAGFWRALGLTPPSEPDHVAALLGLYASLIDLEVKAGRDGDAARTLLRRESRTALLFEHLLSWLPLYVEVVIDQAPPFYARWATLLRDALATETRELGIPDRLPLHLRAAPELPSADAPAGDWISALLAPVRSGVIITRPDLARAAASLGIGARAGERAYILRSLLEQDARGTAGWLAGEARRAATGHRSRLPTLGPIAAFWTARAEGTTAALELDAVASPAAGPVLKPTALGGTSEEPAGEPVAIPTSASGS